MLQMRRSESLCTGLSCQKCKMLCMWEIRRTYRTSTCFFLRANASPGNVRMPHKDHRMVCPLWRFLQGLLIHNHLVVFRSSLGSLYPAHQQNSGSFKNTFTHFNHPLQSCFSSVGTMGRETGIFLVCRFVFLRNCLFFRGESRYFNLPNNAQHREG
jgi:hypothetical protein